MKKIMLVKPLDNYKLHLEYDDGVVGDVDLSELVGKGVFSYRNDPKNFKNVKIEPFMNTVQRTDDLDLCPDSLWMKITGKNLYPTYS
jgi:hypothetical protein